MHFGYGHPQVNDIAQGEGRSDAVEGVGGEGQSEAIGQDKLNAVCPWLPPGLGAGDGQHLGRDVYRYHLISAACQGEGQLTGAGGHI
jgi:hypothetical protein